METTEIIAELRKVVAIGDSPVFCGASYIPKLVAMEAADVLERQQQRLRDLSELVIRQGDEYAKLRRESESVVHAHWVWKSNGYRFRHECSNCQRESEWKDPFCSKCGAHMDETLEIRTCYCPICDKHFEVRSNDSMGNCPDCGHHVVLHRLEESE